MFVERFFQLKKKLVGKPGFGYNGFGEIVFYRTYSRLNPHQEDWIDTCTRVINGVMSIRKDHYFKMKIHWDETYWQDYAYRMGQSLLRLKWSPPGRGLWSMGTDLIYERGSMALYNCLFTDIEGVEDLCWLMDSLMWGCGVGFEAKRTNFRLSPRNDASRSFVIPDTREGWVDSVRVLLNSYLKDRLTVKFNYSKIRKEGTLIRTFGGYASGPAPLQALHERIVELCDRYIIDDDYAEIAFKTDLANLIGVCVVTGNVRRSAQIAVGNINDSIFVDLKNYDKYPYRSSWGWMSNNSVALEEAADFDQLDYIAYKNLHAHDLGYINRMNFPYGRIGKDDNVPYDHATGINPCGEIPLENKESCNVVETFPTRCVNVEDWLNACEFATFYASTVALLPTHSEASNRVILRNRRIGVSIVDVSGWKHDSGTNRLIRRLRRGYQHVRVVNKQLADEAGVPASIRVTTIKPGGTVPKLAGRTSGIGHPTFHYTLRRIRVQETHPLVPILKEANIPYESDAYTKQTLCFEYPILQGPARPATEVSLWEQAMNVVLMQREWADNAVSNTLYFNRDTERGLIEPVLSSIAPLTKSISLLPHSDVGAFVQMPEEGISLKEYNRRVAEIKPIDWTRYTGSDGQDTKFCDGEACELI